MRLLLPRRFTAFEAASADAAAARRRTTTATTMAVKNAAMAAAMTALMKSARETPKTPILSVADAPAASDSRAAGGVGEALEVTLSTFAGVDCANVCVCESDGVGVAMEL